MEPLKKLEPQRILYASLGSMLLAFGLFNIHAQTQISEGGILGLTLLLDNWFSISCAITSFVFNAACYLMAWKEMGNRFIAYSFISIVAYSVSYALFEWIGPLFPNLPQHPLISSIAGALFVGFGVGIAMKSGAAPGGDDALALLISKHTSLKIQDAYLITDLIVLVLSLTYIPFQKIAYSLLTVILSGQLIGIIMKK